MFRALVMLAALGLAGCSVESAFLCRNDGNCGQDGQCEDDGNCSFPDATCESGRRYGDAGDDLHAQTCVDPDPQGTSTTGSTTTGSTTSGGVTTSTSTLPTESTTSTTSGTSGTTTAPITDSDSDTTSSGTTSGTTDPDTTSSTTGDTGETETETGSMGETEFFDDFERANSDNLGNGWVEKTPDAFSLLGGRVRRDSTPTEYQNNLVLRPAPAAGVNLVADIQFDIDSLTPELGNPQLHGRVQEQSVSTSGFVTSYIAFIGDNVNDPLCIGRMVAGALEMSTCGELTVEFIEGQSYSLALRVEGVGPVLVTGEVYALEPDTKRWEPAGTITWTDTSAEAITDRGRVGFSASLESGSYHFDNFYTDTWDE